MPPPAEGLASRLFMGPALRTQPDRRLVTLVREGYEAAFEEIVRRYGRPLGRYAASIVGGRSEDVLQDAFAKALPALQRDDAEIDLRPWLFRIVRNTALNDLRDSPPTPELLAEALAGGRNPADELEQREELTDLIKRLQALPEPQRAAIVMRELEGLGHEEIAAALGLTDGGARQAIYRARQALRDGAGLLLPLPLVRLLIDHGGDAVGVGAGASGALAAGASAGGAGAGGALKLGALAAVVAGSVGAGVAVQQDHRGSDPAGTGQVTTVSSAPSHPDSAGGLPVASKLVGAALASAGEHGEDSDSNRGSHGGESGPAAGGTVEVDNRRESSGPGPSLDPSGSDQERGPDGRGRGRGQGNGRHGEHPGEDMGRHAGSSGRDGHGGGSGSGSGHSGGGESGASGGSGGHGGDGSGGGELTASDGSGHGGSGPDGGSGHGGGSGSGPGPSGGSEATQPPPPPESTSGDHGDGSGSSSGGSGGSDNGSPSHGSPSGHGGDGGEAPRS